MAASLYIYYRVDGNFPSFERAARQIMAQITMETQIKGRLLQRLDDAHTWMEIYEPVPDPAALTAALARAVAADACWQGVARHTECFTEI